MLALSKRQVFVFAASGLSGLFVSIQLVPLEYRYVAIVGLFLASYLVSAWSLFEDLKGVEWITVLSLPALFSASFGLFCYLLPDGWFYKLVATILFGVGMYGALLTENIYSVAASRTIQLLRAAHAVGFLLSIITVVLFYNTIFSLKTDWWVNGLLAFITSLPIFIQGLWSINLEKKLSFEVINESIGFSVMVGVVALSLSLMPVSVWVASLVLGSLVYVSMGIVQHELNDRLFNRTVNEYLIVGLVVLAAAMWVTEWR